MHFALPAAGLVPPEMKAFQASRWREEMREILTEDFALQFSDDVSEEQLINAGESATGAKELVPGLAAARLIGLTLFLRKENFLLDLEKRVIGE